MACSGCTLYASKPIISEYIEPDRTKIISSFTYEIKSPWENSRFKKSAYEATKKIIPNAKNSIAKPTALNRPELEIIISEYSSGGACTQEYLTGLSLGLIPSWCTRHELFNFHFILNNNHGFCRQKYYSISSTTFSHILLVPFAIFNAEDQPLTLYQAALKDFLHDEQCATS
jgi:hypothetical protein